MRAVLSPMRATADTTRSSVRARGAAFVAAGAGVGAVVGASLVLPRRKRTG